MEDHFSQIHSIVSLCRDNDAIFICDKDGSIAYCHCPLDHYFKPEEITGKHILDVFPYLTQANSPAMQVLRSGEALLNHMVETVSCQGDSFLFLTSAIPVRMAGEVVGAVDTFKFYPSGRIWDGAPDAANLRTLKDMVGHTPSMLSLRARVWETSKSADPVLLYGEPGTGKHLVAQCLHAEGMRAGGPFLHQCCTTFPSPVLEAILFGTEEGCYTGALRREGLFERASGGTLYLSHIERMEHRLQKKLIHALEHKKIRRMGGLEDIPFDVRIVCSMNKNPRTCLLENQLMEELYCQISKAKLALPPLRDHRDDILPLAEFFIERFHRAAGRARKPLSPLAEGLLQTYAWPGNVRELRDTIEGALHTADERGISVRDLHGILTPGEGTGCFQAAPPDLKGNFSLTAALEVYERGLIRQALSQTVSVAEAARLLGLSRQLLQYKMQKFEL